MEHPKYVGQDGTADGQRIKSLDTTFAIITQLMQLDGARITELATATGLSKSSVHKHLTSLRQEGYVVKEGDTYRLGMRFLEVGGYVRNRLPKSNAIRGKVSELAAETEETVQFAVAEHGRAVIVFREAGRHGVYTRGRVGKRFYIHQTSSGKAMLSKMSDEEVQEIVRRQGLPKLTENTITDPDRLLEELDRIRDRGYAINKNESTEGLRSVGAPIERPNGELLGAMAIVGPSSRLKGTRLERELPDLLQGIVHELELNLTYA